MITPRVGDIVWFRSGANETNLASEEPLAAIVTYVHHDAMINLVVFGKGGDCHQRASATLWHGEGDVPARISYAEWMPDRDKVKDAPKVDDVERLKGETDADYDSRNSLNRKRMTDDWSRKNGIAPARIEPVQPVDWKPLPASTPFPPVADLPRLAGENDQHYKDRNDFNRKKMADDWNAGAGEQKVPRAPVKPAALPPAPVDPDPYASSVE
jgi:hypothetical protein